MGEGDEELGRILMKGFIFALTQQEHLPSAILFYNGGARLTCEDSASLEDLKNLASLGVEILTCGTCLNHYGLTDKLAVGDVTNMYVIRCRPTSFCARDAAQTAVCGHRVCVHRAGARGRSHVHAARSAWTHDPDSLSGERRLRTGMEDRNKRGTGAPRRSA